MKTKFKQITCGIGALIFIAVTPTLLFACADKSNDSMPPTQILTQADQKKDKIIDHIFRCNERRVEKDLATEYADKVAKTAAYNATCESDE